MKQCSWCLKEFKPSVSYQIYCSVECRDLATKEKIADRYHINRRKKRSKKQRFCAGECGTELSIYNDNLFCNTCMVNNKKVDRTLKQVKRFFEYEKK
jgi:uncharacterized protein YmfQ (DUF2313 family)